MSRDELMHPVFLNCCRLAVDIFWKNLFEDLAYGITPYGTYIANDTINCRSSSGAIVSILIDNIDPEKTYTDVYNILFNVMNISSPEQRIQAQDMFRNIEESSLSARREWTDIRKKNTKDILIDIFIAKNKEEFNLSLRDSINLKTNITSALAFGTITSANIHMDKGYIVSIDNISFEDGKVINSTPPHMDEDDIGDVIDSIQSIDINPKTKSISDLWKKYIEDIHKKTNTDGDM
jgi:hypothetical protein